MKISAIMPVHNEEEYLPRSLSSLRNLNTKVDEFIFILDRCTDRSEEIIREIFPEGKIIHKHEAKWRNSLAENVQMGYKASSGDVIWIVEADIVVPPNILEVLLPELKGNIVSVSAKVITDKSVSFMNLLYHYWEKTYNFSPLGREPRGACRLILRRALDEVGGYKDALVVDSQLDRDLRSLGYEVKFVDKISCLHIRRFSFRKAIRSQKRSGVYRRQVNMPFWRVLGHSIIRLRPFVLYGYLKGSLD
jgi:glycosyltransferase involved in cell wall biosynthesis